jgi:Cu+-exporting ATPase
MEDPVCGAQVDEKSAAATSSHHGQTYAFCSKECKEKFDRNPERFVHSAQESQQVKHGSQKQHHGSQQQGSLQRGSQYQEKATR